MPLIYNQTFFKGSKDVKMKLYSVRNKIRSKNKYRIYNLFLLMQLDPMYMCKYLNSHFSSIKY